eukprot:gb/GFBE01001658.1/.p1 GENE.gb/GFBE01001658.1/~~gb/GFBE01001658.1/.p1  ORF type:complete len:208 (+),score=45.64 gb/GFBE01001658.1/:1-624(+)
MRRDQENEESGQGRSKTCAKKVRLSGFPADLCNFVDVNGEYTLRLINHNGSPVYKRTADDDVFIVKWFGGDMANKWIVKQGKGSASFLFVAEGDVNSAEYSDFKAIDWKVAFRGRLRPCRSCSSAGFGGVVNLENSHEVAAAAANAADATLDDGDIGKLDVELSEASFNGDRLAKAPFFQDGAVGHLDARCSEGSPRACDPCKAYTC